MTVKGHKDRQEAVRKHLSAYPELEIFWYEGVQTMPGWQGLFQQMQHAVEDCYDEPYCIIAEDDIELTGSYSDTHLESLINYSRQLHADVLLGGVDYYSALDRTSKKELLFTYNFKGSHFMVLFKKFYDVFLKQGLPPRGESGTGILEYQHPPEIFIGSQREFIRVLAYPFIAIQSDAPSSFGRDMVRAGYLRTERQVANWIKNK